MDTEGTRPASGLSPGVDYYPLGRYMEQSYLDYSISVVMSRAIPDVRDGLKPVHRRILYAMKKLGLGPATVHKKSARVVGDVIGKYHPHGDSSVYDAMVLMSQPFSLRHHLIDGQGNWGSIDGDAPAAMRYTECRLTPYANLLLEEIDRGTVDFRLNYDGNEDEPVCLPARVPMALLNDQLGIAVGMATDIPAHNLGEVIKGAIALYKNPNTTVKGLMRHIKGPDFPCGAQVTNARAELEELYNTGRGMLTVRGRYEVKRDADGWHLVFTELPPRVSPEQVLLEIDGISNPQPKKGKTAKSTKGLIGGLTAEQRAAKAVILGKISDVANGAGKETGPVYLEIYPKSTRQKPEELANYLFSVTSLETRVKVNMNFINLAGLPRTMSLLDILTDWNRFRFDTVTRRCHHRLEKVEARLHILEGFKKVLIDIDEVIGIIRSSDDDKIAKASLMERWSLSEIQADKILDMKLRQLTKLDELAIDKELADLGEERTGLLNVLGDDAAMIALIIAELEADAEKYGTPRRTVIEEAEEAAFDDKVIDEPVTIILSRKGWIRSRSGHHVDLGTLTYKDGDGLAGVVETRTTRAVLLIDAKGRVYTVGAGQVPGGRGEGVPLSTLIDVQEGAALVSLFAAQEKDKVFLASAKGYGFITDGANLFGRNKAGKAILNADGGAVLPPIVLGEKTTHIAVANTEGYLLHFPVEEVGEYPKGKGNKLLALKKGEALFAVVAFADELALPPKRGKRMIILSGEGLEDYERKRGSRGRLIPKNAKLPDHGLQGEGQPPEPDETVGPEDDGQLEMF